MWLVGLALVIPMGLSGQQEGDTYEVGTALPPVDPGRTLVEITIEDAVVRALEMNLDIQDCEAQPPDPEVLSAGCGGRVQHDAEQHLRLQTASPT